jgi:hypothetical protein
MSSLSDILTAAKNIVTAVNGVAQAYIGVQGSQNVANVSVATLVKSGQGRVATVVVTTAGSTDGYIYDATNANATTNKIYVIPNTVGAIFVNMPVNLGLVVAPGSGQIIAVSYS